jgi:AcrR family transcriptional regulator
MHWERARKPEQKAVRRNAILDAARSLFSELDYEKVSLNGIARKAGISKPNVYRYFSTREEIFLTIFEAEQGKFVQSLIARLKRIRSKEPADAISRAWVEVALKHRGFLDLLPQLSTSMEKNSSVEQIVHFKKLAYERFGELLQTLEHIHPQLNLEQWSFVVQCAITMMAGLWPFTNPGENVIAAMQHPDVNRTPWEFEPLMVHGLSSLIKGTRVETKD